MQTQFEDADQDFRLSGVTALETVATVDPPDRRSVLFQKPDQFGRVGIFDDGDLDVLRGTSGSDWFFMSDLEEPMSDIRWNEESN